MEIKNGRLKIKSANGNRAPKSWLKQYREHLTREVLEVMAIDGFVYERHTTGYYVECKGSGVTLQFINLLTGNGAYVIFNADLKRSRNTKQGNKGDLLPNGHFRVGRQSKFFRFWQSTNLAEPRRLSSFHDYMGKLRSLVFTAEIGHKNRIKKDSISLLTIPGWQIRAAFEIKQLMDKPQTTSRQSSDNYRTRLPDKESQQTDIQKEFQPIPATGESKCGISTQGSAGISKGTTSSITHLLQRKETNEQWLADYE